MHSQRGMTAGDTSNGSCGEKSLFSKDPLRSMWIQWKFVGKIKNSDDPATPSCLCLLPRCHPESMCCAVLTHFSRVRLCGTPWTVAHQAPLSMGFFRQEYWGGLPFPSLGDLPDPAIKPACLLCLLHWQVGSLPPHTTWVYGNSSRICVLLLCENCINIMLNWFIALFRSTISFYFSVYSFY